MLQAIDGLPEDEREVFDLIRIQGLTYAETASVVGTSVATVQRRLSRDRLRLAQQFSTNAAMIARSGGSPVLLQRRADFSVPVHMHSFLDHRWGCVTRGGLCPASRLLPTFFNAVCWQVARRAGKNLVRSLRLLSCRAATAGHVAR